jgi:serine/threonine protein kinase
MNELEINILCNKYKLQEKIGNGKFGVVYKGIKIKTKENVAIKTETLRTEYKLLKNETSILKYLYDAGSRQIPIVYWFGILNEFTFMVMPLYEKSLHHIATKKTIEIENIFKIMIQCIDIIESIHKHFVIHRDIKSQNFMMKDGELYLIDFGLATFFIDENREHITNTCSQNSIIGTPTYVSFNIHKGNIPSRRDDLISLGYMFIFLYCAELPWSNIKTNNNSIENDNEKRKELKSLDLLSPICSRVHSSLKVYIEYCYSLSFDSSPNYTAIKSLFLHI